MLPADFASADNLFAQEVQALCSSCCVHFKRGLETNATHVSRCCICSCRKAAYLDCAQPAATDRQLRGCVARLLATLLATLLMVLLHRASSPAAGMAVARPTSVAPLAQEQFEVVAQISSHMSKATGPVGQ
jgi:hypothetical protein